MKPVLVIDPAIARPEVESLNIVASMSPSTRYFLPAIAGMEELKEIRPSDSAAILIFGSTASVLENLPWQDLLENWLGQAFESETPVFGFCYGHQLIAKMFGSTVEKVNPGGEKCVGWIDTQIEEGEIEGGPLFYSHYEAVSSVPQNFIRYASRDGSVIDGLKHSRLPILTLQAHPEASAEFVRSRGFAQENQKSEFGHGIIRHFLNSYAGCEVG